MKQKNNLQICRYAEQPEKFLALLSRSGCSFADDISFPIQARYYAEYFGNAYHGDASFIASRDGIVLIIMSGQSVDGVLSDNGQDVRIFTTTENREGGTFLLDLLRDTAQQFHCHTIKVLDHVSAGVMSPFGRTMMLHKAVPKTRILAVADLASSEEELGAGLRKSYRSLVNWGMKTLRFRKVNADSFDAAAFESFRQFHILTAGRETRTLQSWNLQAELIKASRAELLLSYLDDGRLVGASLFVDTGVTTTYAVGVYERSLFKKPLAHAPIFKAMLRAKRRGQRLFVIGDVPPATSVTDKEFSVGWFKSGFTQNLTIGINWTYEL